MCGTLLRLDFLRVSYVVYARTNYLVAKPPFLSSAIDMLVNFFFYRKNEITALNLDSYSAITRPTVGLPLAPDVDKTKFEFSMILVD